MVNRKNQRNIVIAILVVGIIAFSGYSVLTGTIGGLYDITVDIHELASVTVSQHFGLQYESLDNGDTIVVADGIGGLYEKYICMTVIFQMHDTGSGQVRWPAPDNFKAHLIVDNVELEYSDAEQDYIEGSGTPIWNFRFNNLNAVDMGVHNAKITFTGLYPAAEYGYSTRLVGTAVTFFIDNPNVADPDPIEWVSIPDDAQISPTGTLNLEWKFIYFGPIQAVISDNGAGINTQNFQESVGTTRSVKYTYSGTTGWHDIKLILTPMDTYNDAKSDIVKVFVTYGGESPEFPPAVDRIDISVTQEVMNEEPRNVLSSDWFSDIANLGQIQTLIDGTLNIRVTVQPSGAFTSMKVRISETNDVGYVEYTDPVITRGWDGDIFVWNINTDVLSEGIHTVTFMGLDSSIAVWYDNIAVFNVPIRTSGINPMTIAVVTIASVFAIGIVMVINRKSKRTVSYSKKSYGGKY